jgi:hypothetical protein
VTVFFHKFLLQRSLASLHALFAVQTDRDGSLLLCRSLSSFRLPDDTGTHTNTAKKAESNEKSHFRFRSDARIFLVNAANFCQQAPNL